MLNSYGTGESKALKDALGKRIIALEISDSSLTLRFDDLTAVALYDDRQSCCERRYMTTDDDIQAFVDTTLIDADVSKAPSGEAEHGFHEAQFLNVRTNQGVLTIVNHNEHNGYYGGFNLAAREAH